VLNRAAADGLVEKQIIGDAKMPHIKRFRAPVLMWRAESFAYFPLLAGTDLLPSFLQSNATRLSNFDRAITGW